MKRSWKGVNKKIVACIGYIKTSSIHKVVGCSRSYPYRFIKLNKLK